MVQYVKTRSTKLSKFVNINKNIAKLLKIRRKIVKKNHSIKYLLTIYKCLNLPPQLDAQIYK